METMNNLLPKIGIYLLAKETAAQKVPYVLVGGLAVQVNVPRELADYRRPSFDADISTEPIPFEQFSKGYGGQIGKNAKDKFGLRHHLRNGHNSNGVLIEQNVEDNGKSIFLLHFNRVQRELYLRDPEFVPRQIEQESYLLPLVNLEITRENIQTKAKVETKGLELRVLTPESLVKYKFSRVAKKMSEANPEFVSDFYKMVGDRILEEGMNTPLKGIEIEESYLQLMRASTDEKRYNIEKDIYDFVMLKRGILK